MRPVAPCPRCGRPSAAPGNGSTCGGFDCLYHHFAGSPPPQEPGEPRALPWSDPGEVARIAVVRPGRLGDLLLAVPGLRALRRGFPRAEITLIAQPWAAELARRLPWVDRIVPLGEPAGDWASWRHDGAIQHTLNDASSSRYDLVLQLQGDDPDHARLALALGGRATAGFCRDADVGRSFLRLLRMSPREPEILRVLRLAHSLGVSPAGVHLEFPLLPEDLEELVAIPELKELPVHHPVVAMHAGARAPARRWPADRFAELAALLHRRWGATLLLVGGPDEATLSEEVLHASGAPGLNLAGRLSLGGLAALLARVDLFVGNDSGPAQLAAALAPRSVRIIGPANPRRWAPLDRDRHRTVHRPVECSPCEHWECPIDHRCLRWVAVEEVWGEIEEVMGE